MQDICDCALQNVTYRLPEKKVVKENVVTLPSVVGILINTYIRHNALIRNLNAHNKEHYINN